MSVSLDPSSTFQLLPQFIPFPRTQTRAQMWSRGLASRFTDQFHVLRRCLPRVLLSRRFFHVTWTTAGPSFIYRPPVRPRRTQFCLSLFFSLMTNLRLGRDLPPKSRLFVGGSPTTNSFAIVIWRGWRNGSVSATTWDCSRAASPLPFTGTPKLPNSRKRISRAMVIGV